MRAPISGLLTAMLIAIAALSVSAVIAVGIALIGLLLSRLFALTQWQGSLIGMAALAGVAFAAFRLVDSRSDYPSWMDLPDEDYLARVNELPEEPPIVPWRRQRPAQAQPPAQTDKKRKP